MHEKYKKRCLYKTLSFLIDLRIPSNSILLDNKDASIDTYFNRKEYSSIQSIVCNQDCACCSSANKFVLFYSRIIQNKMLKLDITTMINIKDPFCAFLEAIQNKNVPITNLTTILQQEPYFYEAFEILLQNITRENLYFVEQEIEKIDDHILKSIYYMLMYVNKFFKCQRFDFYFGILLEYFEIGIICQFNIGKENHKNSRLEAKSQKFATAIPQSKNNHFILALCAAVYYVKKDTETAQKIFLKIKDKTYHFLDLYSNLLYVKNDAKELASLVMHMNKAYSYKPETYTVLGNYYSLLKDNKNAIKYFKKAIHLDKKCYTNYTLIAYEYITLDNNNEAINNFNQALKHNKNDYRALFGLAELYKNIKMLGVSMFLYKKAAEIQSDNGYCWLNFGAVLIKLERFDEAVHALNRALSLNEEDAVLKLGDCYKKMKKYDEAVQMYEQYVEKQKDPRIIKFLRDYHKTKKNNEKVVYYTSMQ